MKEYFVDVWGGAWNKDANPSILKDYGINKGAHYFKTMEEKERFMHILKRYQRQGMAYFEKEGEMSHKRTIVIATYKYYDKEYTVEHDFGYEYEAEDAIYYFVDGSMTDPWNIICLINECNEDAIPNFDDWTEDKWDELYESKNLYMTECHVERRD